MWEEEQIIVIIIIIIVVKELTPHGSNIEPTEEKMFATKNEEITFFIQARKIKIHLLHS